jgi:hypothetical protein
MTDTILSAWEERERQLRDRAMASKSILIAAMRQHAIAEIEVEYDGFGDSGQIQDVTALDEKGNRMDWPAGVKVSLPGQGQEVKVLDLEEAAEEIAWSLIESFHGGWENNDGGNGNLRFDAEDDKIVWEHNDAYTDYHTTNHEL